MSNTFHDVDNDRSFRSPRAWHRIKLALGWKPELDRTDSSCLVKALLDLEEQARNSGASVRLMLEVAIRNYLRLTREQRFHASVSTFDEYGRKMEGEQIDRDFRAAMEKCGFPDEPADT